MKNVFYFLVIAFGLFSCNENTGKNPQTPNAATDTTQQTTATQPTQKEPVNAKLVGLDLTTASADIKLDKDQIKGYAPASGFGAFLSKMTEVVEIRDNTEEVDVYNVIIKDKTGKEIANLGETYEVFDNGIRFLNNGILEVATNTYYYEDGSDEFSKILRGGPLFSYFGVDAEGQFKKLKSNRLFACTEFTKIDESYLQREFRLPLGDTKVAPKNGFTFHKTHQYLCEEGISYMINEIYASYGYKFKNEKWQKIFEGYTWYQANKDNVDSDFSAIDKHNIEFLKQARDKLKGNEAAILQEKIAEESTAG